MKQQGRLGECHLPTDEPLTVPQSTCSKSASAHQSHAMLHWLSQLPNALLPYRGPGNSVTFICCPQHPFWVKTKYVCTFSCPVVPAEKSPQNEILSGSILDIVTHNSMSPNPFFLIDDSYCCVVLSLLTITVIRIEICLVGTITALLQP